MAVLSFKVIEMFSLVLLLLSNLAHAARLEIKILPSVLIPNPHTLPASTHATLTCETGEILSAPLRKDNTIIFPDIPTIGSHLLDIFSRDFTFTPYRIDTVATSEGPIHIKSVSETYRGTLWSDRGISLLSSTASPVATFTMTPKVVAAKTFYDPRPYFNPLSLLRNPMILMGVVALAFTFGMPKLLENMDPEMRAEYEEMQKKGPMSSIMGREGGSGGASAKAPGSDFDLAGYLAGSGKKQGDATGRDVGEARERKK